MNLLHNIDLCCFGSAYQCFTHRDGSFLSPPLLCLEDIQCKFGGAPAARNDNPLFFLTPTNLQEGDEEGEEKPDIDHLDIRRLRQRHRHIYEPGNHFEVLFSQRAAYMVVRTSMTVRLTVMMASQSCKMSVFLNDGAKIRINCTKHLLCKSRLKIARFTKPQHNNFSDRGSTKNFDYIYLNSRPTTIQSRQSPTFPTDGTLT